MVQDSRSDGPSWPSWKITSKPTDRSSCQRPCDHIYEEWTGSNKTRIEPARRSTAELELEHGGVTERPNVPVLKTGDLARGPRVQISPPPPCFPVKIDLFLP